MSWGEEILKSQLIYIIIYKHLQGSNVMFLCVEFSTFPAAIGAGPGVAGVEVTRLRA